MRLTFRSKLLVALVGAVAVLLGATLLAIRAETNRQVERAVTRATEQSRAAFRETEQFWQTQLRALANSVTGPTWISAALQAAIEGGDATDLIDATLQQQEVAQLTDVLFAYTDLDANPVVAIVNRETIPSAVDAVPHPLVEGMLFQGDTTSFGYQLVGTRLFAVHVAPLFVPGAPVGTITVGVPVDEATARRLGDLAGTEVCFVVRERCAASTVPVSGTLARLMVEMADKATRRQVVVNDVHFALASDRIATGSTGGGWRVIAVPLESVLEPFSRIVRAMAWAGAIALGFAVLLGSVLARGLSTPIRNLVAATGRVARGDYEFDVPVTSHDELGALATSFNEMIAGLRLKERYRGVLDKVVSREIADELMKGEVSLGGENREVTTMFADIRGFTALTEGMEPQRVIALLNEYARRGSDAVESEGGVVDKYVGDEVMAIFGTPLPQKNHALHAVRAALRLRDAMLELSEERVAQGEAPIGIGIGINTGNAVAGNMGSVKRLNYTVLGASVNLASRLCDVAAAGEILISAATYEAIRDDVDAVATAPRSLKGFAQDVMAYAVRGLAAHAGAARVLAWMVAAGLAVGAAPLSAQEEDGFPTLRGAGIQYVSPSGWLQISPAGRIDLELYAPHGSRAWIIEKQDPFVAPRLLLTSDFFFGSHVYGFTELRWDENEVPGSGDFEPRVQQLFLRVTPHEAVSLQVGRFVTPFGEYAQRHHTSADPLIRPPIHHDYRTMIWAHRAPGSVEGFVRWKDDVPIDFRPQGLPPIWGIPYQDGAMVLANRGPFAFRYAIMSSAPGSPPEAWPWPDDGLDAASHVVQAQVQVVPSLRIAASFDSGPYLQPDVEMLPADMDYLHYKQRLWGLDVFYQRGPVELRAEGIIDEWDVPNVEDYAEDYTLSVEGKVKTGARTYVAARAGTLRFNRIATSTGPQKWDYDVNRLQVGGGFRYKRNVGLKAEYMVTQSERPGEAAAGLAALMGWWEF